MRPEGRMTTGREQSFASTSQGWPATPEAGRGQEGFPLQISEECDPADMWNSDFPPPELGKNAFLLF